MTRNTARFIIATEHRIRDLMNMSLIAFLYVACFGGLGAIAGFIGAGFVLPSQASSYAFERAILIGVFIFQCSLISITFLCRGIVRLGQKVADVRKEALDIIRGVKAPDDDDRRGAVSHTAKGGELSQVRR